MNTALELKGEINGREHVIAMINSCPEVFHRYLYSLLNKGGAYFIGTSKKTSKSNLHGTGKGSRAKVQEWNSKFGYTPAKGGLIRSQMYDKKGVLGFPWDDQFIHAAMRYFIGGANVKDNLRMNLRAGSVSKTNSSNQAFRIAEALESGATFTSNKYMTIPIYDNFTANVKRRSTLRNRSDYSYAKQIVQKLIESGRISIIKKNGSLYYVDKVTDKILMVGKKSVKIKKQFEFFNKWNQAVPAIEQGLNESIDAACKNVMEKYNG